MGSSGHQVTELLRRWSAGDESAAQALLPLVYRELHKIAKRYMVRQGPDHTLQTTAVIHEAYLKLAGGDHDWESRGHFFGVAAKAMRHVLVDHARNSLSAKRGAEVRFVPLEEAIAFVAGKEPELIALDEALTCLADLHPRKAQVVELRYFGGLSIEETAAVLRVSPDTVSRDWQLAKAFLQREVRKATTPL